MKNIYIKAGERICLTRIMRGYTREYLAEMTGISSKFLYEIEVGKKGFSAEVLCKICNALKVNCDYILTGKKNIDCDKNVINVIELFEKNKIEQIAKILEDIYELIEFE